MPSTALAATNNNLVDIMGELVDKPLAYTYFNYPWGEPGPLEREVGPDAWQIEVLQCVEEALHAPGDEGVRIGVSSGNGAGKGALAAFNLQWFMSTRVNPQIDITANTGVQLRTKTWREVAKWHQLMRNSHWFTVNQQRMYHNQYPLTWQATPITWDASKPEAFAGTHEKEGHVLRIFDEASTIPDILWDHAEGAMTTGKAIWLVMGNMTRATGRFTEIFPGGRFAHRWNTWQIDIRTCKKASLSLVNQWIEDYGEDSDFVRIHVKGLKPRSSSRQLIGDDIVLAAQRRTAVAFEHSPRILGVDVAREGKARTVLLDRQGSRIHEIQVYRNLTFPETSQRVSDTMDRLGYDAVFIDAVGLGYGVIDDLRRRGYNVIAIKGSEKASPKGQVKYFNKRSEMWGDTLDWLIEWGCLPQDTERYGSELAAELILPEYTYHGHDQILLEPKDSMAASPDIADALTLTFGRPVRRRDEVHRGTTYALGGRGGQTQDPYALARGGMR